MYTSGVEHFHICSVLSWRVHAPFPLSVFITENSGVAMRGFRPRFSQFRRISSFLSLFSESSIDFGYFVFVASCLGSVGTFMNWKKIVSSSVTLPVNGGRRWNLIKSTRDDYLRRRRLFWKLRILPRIQFAPRESSSRRLEGGGDDGSLRTITPSVERINITVIDIHRFRWKERNDRGGYDYGERWTREIGGKGKGCNDARGVFNELEDTGKGWKLA